MPAFALAPGASNYDIGLLTTIVFFSQMMQLPGLLLMRACPVRRSLAVIVAALARSLWVLIIFIPLFFLNRGVTFLIQWLFISSFIGAAAGALSPMVAGIFADFFASRELAISVNWAEPEKAFAMHAMNKQDELYPLRLLTARNARFQNEFGRFTNYKRRI